VLQFLLSSGEPFLPAPQGGDRRFEPLSMEWLIIESLGDRLVDDIQPVEIVGDLFLGMRDVAREPFGTSYVLGAGDGAHLRAVERDRAPANKVLFPTELHERDARRYDRAGKVVPEGGGAVVQLQPPHQPDSLKISATGTLEMPRGSNLVEIAPDIEAQHIARMITGPASGGRFRPCEAQIDKVQTVDKGIDDADKAIRRNIVVNVRGEQAGLRSIGSFDAAHKTSARAVNDGSMLDEDHPYQSNYLFYTAASMFSESYAVRPFSLRSL
jgi:hypothetical protein